MFDRLVMWLGGEAKTVAFAIVGGVVGFLAKGAYDLWSARRKERLDRVNKQLKLLYGPLYALNRSSNIAWSAFRKRLRPDASFVFDRDHPLTQSELEAWRRWLLTVFKPIHEEMLATITKNSDLLIGAEFPEALKTFCAHAAAYKVVFEQWSKNDFSEHFAVVAYPADDLNEYLETSFRKLKSEQGRLLGMRLH
jgi:hypothetical protein